VRVLSTATRLHREARVGYREITRAGERERERKRGGYYVQERERERKQAVLSRLRERERHIGGQRKERIMTVGLS